ncbi:DUF6286 domain-containing protein [Williamsia phyllosphaerae]|uniref:DUF6286 domain-containing protein n=1 Tax=Williamsia phyllosphaerae TaxID=885042 RepID=A0ABQ1UGQ0_9NOCA|nr:DUF6286 domain-containing protein [Williamsia phyllosphaerae]GGF18237.1 hypothetical protein GCM10007298_12850 [Williamsia phyllosphaerae]
MTTPTPSDAYDVPVPDARKLKPPTATPGSVVVTTLFALVLLALAGIAIRDFIIEMKWISGTQWIAAASRWISSLSWQVWMRPAAVALIIIGLWFLIVSITPRSKTHFAVDGVEDVDGYSPSTWTRRVDVARRSSAVARDVRGVLEANSVVKRRKVKVSVLLSEDSSETRADITERITAAIAPVAPGRTVKLKARVKKVDQSVAPPAPIARPAMPESFATEAAKSESASESESPTLIKEQS